MPANKMRSHQGKSMRRFDGAEAPFSSPFSLHDFLAPSGFAALSGELGESSPFPSIWLHIDGSNRDRAKRSSLTAREDGFSLSLFGALWATSSPFGAGCVMLAYPFWHRWRIRNGDCFRNMSFRLRVVCVFPTICARGGV